MKCLKKLSVSFIACFCLFVIVLFGIFSPVNTINSYASDSTSSGTVYDWSAGEQFMYFVLNWANILGDGYSFIIGADDADEVWSDFMDYVSLTYLMENETFDEWVLSQTSWYYDNSGIQNQNTVTGLSLTPTMADALQLTINNYVQDNPLTYTMASISSYNYLNSSYFGNFTQYKNFQEIMKNADLTFVHTSSPGWNGSNKYLCFITVDRSIYDVNFYGSVVNGAFSSVSLEHNWSNVSSFPENKNGIVYYFTEYNSNKIGRGSNIINAQVDYWGNDHYYRDVPSLTGNVTNNTGIGLNNKANVFTSKIKNENVFVYGSLNAIKSFNSGTPQPYYLGSDFGTHKTTYNINDFSNSNNSYYNQVVEQVHSGLTADELIEIIDKIIGEGGSGGGSGSDSGFDNPFAFLGKIGEVIGSLVNGIGNLIVNILEGISKAFLGEDGHGGILGLVSNVLSSLTTLISEDFAEFINGIFSFMPTELRTILIAGFTISVFLGVLRMIRK